MRPRDLVTAVRHAIGRDEIILLLALGLITSALWPLVGRVALVIPGVVLLWLVLPSRGPLVWRQPSTKGKG